MFIGGDQFDVDADIPELEELSIHDPEFEGTIYNLGDEADFDFEI